MEGSVWLPLQFGSSIGQVLGLLGSPLGQPLSGLCHWPRSRHTSEEVLEPERATVTVVSSFAAVVAILVARGSGDILSVPQIGYKAGVTRERLLDCMGVEVHGLQYPSGLRKFPQC